MTDLAFTPSTGGVILDIPAETYHDDAVGDTPSLSASIASVLVTQSPRHAWAQHPKLNPDYAREEKPHFDLGTLVHQLLLEGHMDSLEVIDADNYRTNAAKDARDEAYKAGKTPILVGDLPRVTEMVQAVGEQLAGHSAAPALFTAGKAEQTLVWDDDGVACRARLDWLRDDRSALDDLKTTGQTADPVACAKALYGWGYDIRAAFYLRGCWKVLGAKPTFRWCFVETKAPYAVSVVTPGPDVLELGAAKVAYALARWRECLASGHWPAYTEETFVAEVPSWEQQRWADRDAG